MKLIRGKVCLFLLALMSQAAVAELENVVVGGSLGISGYYYSEFYEDEGSGSRTPYRLFKRSLGPNGMDSPIRADGHGNGQAIVGERMRLHTTASLTNQIAGFIELDSCYTWGENFRSEYITGADTQGNDSVGLYQAYVEVSDLLGKPFTLKIGRQELSFGSGWLVGSNPDPLPYTGLSFDAARLTILADPFTVDLFSSKVAERGPIEEDGDIDFHGINLGYSGPENVLSEVYWFNLRDAGSQENRQWDWSGEWVEDRLGLDDYDPTNLHTIGLRNAGEYASFDWEVEAAYQFGSADAVGVLFVPEMLTYGDQRARWDTWAAHGEIGYTFETKWYPRPYWAFHYFGGEDNRDVSLRDILNPFKSPKASVSFNRLFSDYENDAFFDGSALSNYWQTQLGIQIQPHDKIVLTTDIAYLQVVAPFRYPVGSSCGGKMYPYLSPLSFWTKKGNTDLGWLYNAALVYQYTEDISLELGYSHIFAGKAFSGGGYIFDNGLTNTGALGRRDADYFTFLTEIQF